MTTIRPVGQKLLVLPLKTEETTTKANLIVSDVDANLSKGKVVAVSQEIAHLYQEGDVVLYAAKSGIGQYLNGEHHQWLSHDSGNIWGILTETQEG